MSPKRTLFFYGNPVGDKVRQTRRIFGDSPAAARKMVSLCRALRTQNVKAVMVSMGRGSSRGSPFYHSAFVGRLGGIPIIYGPYVSCPLISQFVSSVWLAYCGIALNFRSRDAVHLFYNQLTLYLPLLLLFRVVRPRVFGDLEDGNITSQKVEYSRKFGDLSPKLFSFLVPDGTLLASSRLFEHTAIRPAIPYYGSIPKRVILPDAERFHGPKLVAVLTGYLNEDTGLEIILGALKIMRTRNMPIFRSLEIWISGSGPGQEALAPFANIRGPQLSLLGLLDDGQYAALMRDAHIGLSVKPVTGAVSETTFPSKTVQYAESGLAIIATDISDVRKLFGETVLYLNGNDPEALVAYLQMLLKDRDLAFTLASRSSSIINEKLTDDKSGRQLCEFFFDQGETAL